MTPATRAERHEVDLDKADRRDKWNPVVWVLALLLVGAVSWALIAQSDTAKRIAESEASQKFTLAQQVAAACALKDQADDLGGLCQSATQIVKDGPAGSQGIQGPPGAVGAQGPLGPKGEPGIGVQGIQGIQGIQGLLGKGINGRTGAVGPQGATGFGETGPSGKDGTNGANGTDGTNGANGTDGISAFPFSFTFSIPSGTYNCTVVSPTTEASCTEASKVPVPTTAP